MYIYTCVQDPDAPTRQKRKLSELDTKDELSLNKHLFACIRAGQLDEVYYTHSCQLESCNRQSHSLQALGMCVNSGQPLKALMLEGWKLHHDPNMARRKPFCVWYIPLQSYLLQKELINWNPLKAMSSEISGRRLAGRCWMR